MRHKGIALAALFVVALAGYGAPAEWPDGCIAANPATPALASSCAFEATERGGIDAVGSWRVEIVREDADPIVIDSAALPPTCYPIGRRTVCPIGHILPGDDVIVEARAQGSVAGAGNPCPVPNPGLPPPILGGEC